MKKKYETPELTVEGNVEVVTAGGGLLSQII